MKMSVLMKEKKHATQVLTVTPVPLDEALRWTLATKRRGAVAGSDASYTVIKWQKHIFQMVVVFWKSSSEISGSVQSRVKSARFMCWVKMPRVQHRAETSLWIQPIYRRSSSQKWLKTPTAAGKHATNALIQNDWTTWPSKKNPPRTPSTQMTW